jgi:hypothetical protein
MPGWKNWKARNPQRFKELTKKAQSKVSERNARIVWEYLLQHPCVDCGERDPIVLEFDHVQGNKVNLISVLIHRCSKGTLQLEIEKCEVRCANCHRRKHAEERNYYKMAFLS